MLICTVVLTRQHVKMLLIPYGRKLSREKTFAYSHKTAKFTKVFSLEIFLLCGVSCTVVLPKQMSYITVIDGLLANGMKS